MKTILFFLFISISSFSQNLESIKDLDTVYIYFNYGKYEKYGHIKKKENISNKFRENYTTYAFSLDNYNIIYFYYNDYKDFDDYEKGIKADVKKVKKKFLKKNKEKILGIDFFINNGFDKVFSILYTTQKKIYIIDSDEIKKRNIVLREVRMDAPNFTPE